MDFAQVALECWLRQISLSATGFYRTPDIRYDAKAGKGKPFHYYAYGAAVTEVEVDGFTGMYDVTPDHRPILGGVPGLEGYKPPELPPKSVVPS